MPVEIGVGAFAFTFAYRNRRETAAQVVERCKAAFAASGIPLGFDIEWDGDESDLTSQLVATTYPINARRADDAITTDDRTRLRERVPVDRRGA